MFQEANYLYYSNVSFIATMDLHKHSWILSLIFQEFKEPTTGSLPLSSAWTAMMKGMCRGREMLITGAHCTSGSVMPLDSSRDRRGKWAALQDRMQVDIN